MNELSLKKIDPRPKLMIMASSSSVCMLTENIFMLLAIIVILIATMIIGNASITLALKRVRGILGIIVALFIVQSIFIRPIEGDFTPLIMIGSVGLFYVEGLSLGAVLSLRLIVILLSALILVEGETRDYLLAFVQMKIPYVISFMVVVAVHFIPILREEAINIYCCMQLRGKDFEHINIFEKLKAYFKLCLPILVSALRRAEEMSIAMEVRGFRAKTGRTNMRKLKMQKIDIFLLIFWPVMMIVLYLLFEFALQ